MMSGTSTVLTSIEQADPTEWDSILGPNSLIQSRRYLLAIEKSRVNDCEHRYFLYRREDGALVAHTSFYYITTKMDVFLPPDSILARAIGGIRRTKPSFLTMRMIECGTPTALGNTLSFAPVTSANERQHILETLVEAMEEFAKERKASLLIIRDFRQQEVKEYAYFESLGFHLIPNLPNTKLLIRWNSFDDYLNSLRSTRRSSIKRNVARAENNGIRCEHIFNYAPFVDEMTTLWQAIASRSKSYQREVLDRDYFLNLNDGVPERSMAALFWKNEKLVAFLLYLIDEAQIIALYNGVDYDHNQDAALVLNSYYDAIRTAIHLKKEVLELGSTTYTPKLRLGAEIDPLLIYARHRFKLINGAFAQLYRWTTPVPTETTKLVFKDELA